MLSINQSSEVIKSYSCLSRQTKSNFVSRVFQIACIAIHCSTLAQPMAQYREWTVARATQMKFVCATSHYAYHYLSPPSGFENTSLWKIKGIPKNSDEFQNLCGGRGGGCYCHYPGNCISGQYEHN